MSKIKLVDTIIGVIGGIAGLIGIFTGIKCAADEEAELDARLEKKYGLTPVQEEVTKE